MGEAYIIFQAFLKIPVTEKGNEPENVHVIT